MATDFEEVLQLGLSLPEIDRLLLASKLLDSLPGGSLSCDSSHCFNGDASGNFKDTVELSQQFPLHLNNDKLENKSKFRDDK